MLKEGPVTVSRFCNIGGKYKLFITGGTAVKADMYTPGCMVNVVTEAPVRSVIEGIIKEGVPHHYAVVWEDVMDDMITLAEILGIEVMRY